MFEPIYNVLLGSMKECRGLLSIELRGRRLVGLMAASSAVRVGVSAPPGNMTEWSLERNFGQVWPLFNPRFLCSLPSHGNCFKWLL